MATSFNGHALLDLHQLLGDRRALDLALDARLFLLHDLNRTLYHTSRPFASRVVARSHLEPLQLSQMCDYLRHHLRIAGGRPELFDEQALTAIHQSSGGALRRANNIARGALMAAAAEQAAVVTAEHARLEVTEIL